MERNDVSFSIPTWRQEEIKSIKSIGIAEEEVLYMASPYNLNDFKNAHQSVEYIFASNQEPSQLQPYTTKRLLHPKVTKQIAIFTTFLYEIIMNDNYLKNQKTQTSEKALIEDKQNSKLLGLFKQKIFQLNMCKFDDIPKEFQIYYRNQIIKKVIFQYFGKCAYNTSLIQILLMNNDFLRFSIEVCVKSVLFQGTLLSKFNDEVTFNEEVKMFVEYFGYLFVIKKDTKEGAKHSQLKPKGIFKFESNALKAQHYLLKQTKDKKIYLYRKQIKLNDPVTLTEDTKQTKQDNVTKKKQGGQPKLKSVNTNKPKNKPQKIQAQNQKRNKSFKDNFMSCCFPCFKKS